MRHNRDAFARIAQLKEGDEYRILLKVAGKLDHGGDEVLKPDSTGYRIVADFVRRTSVSPNGKDGAEVVSDDKNPARFFDGIVMLDFRRLLRRVTPLVVRSAADTVRDRCSSESRSASDASSTRPDS